jgi:endonuclease III
MQPVAQATRLRRCAELAIAEAPWTRFPGIGKPGAERIELFTGTRAVLALDSNALRVLVRLGYGEPGSAYAQTYRQAQAQASAELAETVPARQRAHQLLRRHGQTICRRSTPVCPRCPLADHCPSAVANP